MGDITDTRDELKAKGRQVGGDVKRNVGEATGDRQLQGEGRIEHARGVAEEKVTEGKRDVRKFGGGD